MKQKLDLGIRIIIGLALVIFGANKVLHFIPQPPLSDGASAYMMGLGGSGYFFPLLALSQILIGLSFLTNKFVKLALLALAPIAINMVGFHLAFDLAGGVLAYIVFISAIVLTANRFQEFKPVLSV